MQVIVIIAILLALTAWIVSSYHRLELLRSQANSNWQLVLASLHRRNALLREFIFQLSVIEGTAPLLRELRHAQGDLELSVNSTKASNTQAAQRHNIGSHEAKLHDILGRILHQAAISSHAKLSDFYKQVQQLDHLRQQSIRQYNASVLSYRNRLSTVPYRQIAQALQMPDMLTLSADELPN